MLRVRDITRFKALASCDVRERERPQDGRAVVRAGAIDALDVEQARKEVAPFTRDQRALEIWSRDFFRQIVGRIVAI